MLKVSKIFNEAVDNNITVRHCSTLRDGGSRNIMFSDGFECMYDHGFNSPSIDKFVKSWKDRTVIELEPKYIEAIKASNDSCLKNII